MIYLKSANILFIKPRKVAGTSFEIALSKYATDADIVTPISESDEETRRNVGGKGPLNYLKPFAQYTAKDVYDFVRSRERVMKFYNHISAAEIRGYLGADTFDSATKISIIRNPFDRLVSLYHWRTNDTPEGERPDFTAWVKQNPEAITHNMEHYFVDGQFIIDQAIRYDALVEDCRRVESDIPALTGIAEAMQTIKAKGGIRPKGRDALDYYSQADDLVKKISHVNRDIMDRFGYAIP